MTPDDFDDDLLERLRKRLVEHVSRIAQAQHLAAIHDALIPDADTTTIYFSPQFGVVYHDSTGRREQLDSTGAVLVRTIRGQERPDVYLPRSPQ